jgi:DNA mismatch repair protein MutS2
VGEARAELARARLEVKARAADKQQLASAEKVVNAVAARVALGGDLSSTARAPEARGAPRAALDPGQISPGERVHVTRLRSDAVVIEGPSKGRVRVAVGPLKLWVDGDELAAAEPVAAATRSVRKVPAASPVVGRTPDNTLNLKGMRVDDALSLMESFIDRLSTTDLRVGYVLHGHGTGALRDAVRKHLKTAMPQVQTSGPADPNEGGDAVTVFTLA